MNTLTPPSPIYTSNTTNPMNPTNSTNSTNSTNPTNYLLFIDDEEGIRRSVSRALKRSTFTLLTAPNGHEGLSVVNQMPQRISTVITDYKMPGINGIETLLKVHAINPEITRIILTGYATMEVAIQATNEGIQGENKRHLPAKTIATICSRAHLQTNSKITERPNAGVSRGNGLVRRYP